MLHIGRGWMVFPDQVVAILDMSGTLPPATRAWLRRCQGAGLVTRLDASVRSLVLVDGPLGEQVYMSPLSAAALSARVSSANRRALAPVWDRDGRA